MKTILKIMSVVAFCGFCMGVYINGMMSNSLLQISFGLSGFVFGMFVLIGLIIGAALKSAMFVFDKTMRTTKKPGA